MPRRAPEREWHRIPGEHAVPAPEHARRRVGRVVERDLQRLRDPLAGLSGRRVPERRLQQRRARAWLAPRAHAPCHGRRDRCRHRARLPVGVRVRHLCRGLRLAHERIEVVGEVGSERRDAHRSPVAHRAGAAEGAARAELPRDLGEDVPQNLARCATIAMVRLRGIPAGEGAGEGVLIERAQAIQDLDHAHRHHGVVRVGPRCGRQGPLGEQQRDLVGVGEEALAERVADREAVEGEEGAAHAGGVVGRDGHGFSTGYFVRRVDQTTERVGPHSSVSVVLSPPVENSHLSFPLRTSILSAPS